MSPTRLRPTPFAIGPVHFVGIGGIGMSAIAEIMLRAGYAVQGSDLKAGANTERLEGLGATIHIGHRAENIEGASALVYSTAVKPDNPEYAEAYARRIPLVRRAEMLAELMRLHFSIGVARHPRQDHHHLADRHPARRGRARPDGDQRRDHQRLRLQLQDGRGRLDGGGGRRERRHLPAAEVHRGGGHQHRPRAPGPLRRLRRGEEGLLRLRGEHPLLRLRRGVPGPSRGAGPDLPGAEPAAGDLRDHAHRPRCARSTSRWARTAPASTASSTRARTRRSPTRSCACRSPAATTC